MKIIITVFIAAMLLGGPLQANTDPIATQNRNALVRLNGLPTPETAVLLAPKAQSLRFGLELTSQFVIENNASEQLLIDGETASLNIDWRYGLSKKWELGISIPVLSQGGGFLDGFVDDWHSTFNLPDGNRDSQPQNQLLYSIQNGQQSLVFDDANTGFGDVALSLRRALYNKQQHRVTAFTRLELPTGKAENFTGSNSTDIAVGLNYSNSECVFKAYCHVTAGVLWFGNTEVFNSASRSNSAFASATIAKPIWRKFVAKLQLETHQAMYNSNTDALGKQALQLSFGVARPLAKRWSFDIALSEDISPNTAPDFTFIMGLAYKP